MPLSIFLGRVPEPDEPYWTRHDRHVAVAWLRYRKSLHDCGVPRDIAFDPDNEFLPHDGSGMRQRRWQGEVNHCHVCAAADRARRLYEKAGQGGDVEVNRDGLIVLVTDGGA